jgi:hypothetical protein
MDSEARAKFRDEIAADAQRDFPDAINGLADVVIDLFIITDSLRKQGLYWQRRAHRAEMSCSAGYTRQPKREPHKIFTQPYRPAETDDWIATGVATEKD